MFTLNRALNQEKKKKVSPPNNNARHAKLSPTGNNLPMRIDAHYQTVTARLPVENFRMSSQSNMNMMNKDLQCGSGEFSPEDKNKYIQQRLASAQRRTIHAVPLGAAKEEVQTRRSVQGMIDKRSNLSTIITHRGYNVSHTARRPPALENRN